MRDVQESNIEDIPYVTDRGTLVPFLFRQAYAGISLYAKTTHAKIYIANNYLSNLAIIL